MSKLSKLSLVFLILIMSLFRSKIFGFNPEEIQKFIKHQQMSKQFYKKQQSQKIKLNKRQKFSNKKIKLSQQKARIQKQNKKLAKQLAWLQCASLILLILIISLIDPQNFNFGFNPEEIQKIVKQKQFQQNAQKKQLQKIKIQQQKIKLQQQKARIQKQNEDLKKKLADIDYMTRLIFKFFQKTKKYKLLYSRQVVINEIKTIVTKNIAYFIDHSKSHYLAASFLIQTGVEFLSLLNWQFGQGNQYQSKAGAYGFLPGSEIQIDISKIESYIFNQLQKKNMLRIN